MVQFLRSHSYTSARTFPEKHMGICSGKEVLLEVHERRRDGRVWSAKPATKTWNNKARTTWKQSSQINLTWTWKSDTKTCYRSHSRANCKCRYQNSFLVPLTSVSILPRFLASGGGVKSLHVNTEGNDLCPAWETRTRSRKSKYTTQVSKNLTDHSHTDSTWCRMITATQICVEKSQIRL